MIVCHRTIYIVIEFDKLIYIIPHRLIRSMENMGTICMDMDPIFFLAIDIAAYMMPTINHKTFLSFFLCFMGKNASEKPCPYN